MLDQARTLKKGESTGDVNAVVAVMEDLAEQIQFAKSAEFCIEKGKKTTQVGLNIYDRFNKAGLADLLGLARANFPKSVLDQFTKLEILGQKVVRPPLIM